MLWKDLNETSNFLVKLDTSFWHNLGIQYCAEEARYNLLLYLPFYSEERKMWYSQLCFLVHPVSRIRYLPFFQKYLWNLTTKTIMFLKIKSV